MVKFYYYSASTIAKQIYRQRVKCYKMINRPLPNPRINDIQAELFTCTVAACMQASALNRLDDLKSNPAQAQHNIRKLRELMVDCLMAYASFVSACDDPLFTKDGGPAKANKWQADLEKLVIVHKMLRPAFHEIRDFVHTFERSVCGGDRPWQQKSDIDAAIKQSQANDRRETILSSAEAALEDIKFITTYFNNLGSFKSEQMLPELYQRFFAPVKNR